MWGSCGGSAEGPTPKLRRGERASVTERKPLFVRKQEAWNSPGWRGRWGQMEESTTWERREKRTDETGKTLKRGHRKERRHRLTHCSDGKVCTF